MEQPRTLRVVLDYTEDPDGTIRVYVVGVYEPGARIPDPPAGHTRNVVNVFEGVKMDKPAFKILPPPSTYEEEGTTG